MKPLNLLAPIIVVTGTLALSGCFTDHWYGNGSRDDRVDSQRGQTRCDPHEEHHCRPVDR